MIGRLMHLCERGSDLVSSLPAREQDDARRLLALCLDYAEHSEESAVEVMSADIWTRELSRLIEFLARRNARGIPLATLGRAALAHRASHTAVYAATCAEVEQKLDFLGI